MRIFLDNLCLTLGLSVLFFLSYCGKQYEEIHSGNWNMVVATNLDQTGDLNHAIEYLKLAEKEDEARADARFYLDQIEERKTKAEDCVRDSQFSIDTSYLSKYRFRDYFQMGFCYELLNKPDRAMECYNKSIELNSRHSLAYVYRGLLFEKNGDLKNARLDLEIAIQKEEGHLSPRFLLGMFYLRNGKSELVEEQAVSLEKTRPIYAQILREEQKREYARQ